MKTRSHTKADEMIGWGCLLLVGLLVVGGFARFNNRAQYSTDELNATATALTLKRTLKAEATATAKACEYRETRKWCASRRDWSADAEAKLSALLKAVGGLDALTAKEQERVQEIEHGLAQYRRICEGGGEKSNLSSIVEGIALRLQERRGAGELERELARYRSRC